MLQGVVVGNVWSTKRIDGLPNGAFLEIEVAGEGVSSTQLLTLIRQAGTCLPDVPEPLAGRTRAAEHSVHA